jgi:hypothetical protein
MVGSKVIRPDTEYHLSVMSQGYKEPATFKVSINGTEDDGRVFVQSKDVTLSADETQTLVFDVSKHQIFDDNSDIIVFERLKIELELACEMR